MQKWFKILILPFLLLFLLAGTAMAVNITIFDGSDSLGHYGTGVGLEIGETEPGMVNSSVWDLQAFLLDGNILSMGGEFDFVNGVSGFSAYTSGDIFLDVTGDVTFGDGATSLRNGYDYVIHIDDWKTNNGYSVYSIDDDSDLENVIVDQNRDRSNPWKWNSGGTFIASSTFDTSQSHADYTYYVTGFNLGFLDGHEFTAHFTMGCGNDNLMGSTAPVPEPATMLLLGTGLIGLAGVTRRKIYKK